LEGKVCLVTGATGGLGRAVAEGLARRGARVVLLARDPERGEALRSEIATRTGATVELLPGDLARPASVRHAAALFRAAHDRLDVLVNCAAVFTAQRAVTPDGLETMFATNHLGPFLLANLLLEPLRDAAPSRVVTVTAPATNELDLDDLQGERRFGALQAFGASKAANLLFTHELARRLAGTGVSAAAVHPGVFRSGLMREAAPPIRWLTRLFGASPAAAAEGVVQVAASPDLATAGGGLFFKKGRPIDAPAYTRDPDVGRRLWDVSAAIVGLG
jgi:retinol dehydrogenase-14